MGCKPKWFEELTFFGLINHIVEVIIIADAAIASQYCQQSNRLVLGIAGFLDNQSTKIALA